MKTIPLSQCKFAIVDDSDFDALSQKKWSVNRIKNKLYAHASFNTGFGRVLIKMHHFILGRPLNGLEIDHIDGDGLNNQRSNLRFVTHRQNGNNLSIIKSSKYPGVSYNKSNTHIKKWRSYLTINRKQISLGHFATEEDAFNRYKTAVFEMTGQIIDLKTIKPAR